MDFSYEINNWAAGVVQSLEGDKLPPQALRSALNTMFVNTGGDQTDIGTRPGLKFATTLRDSALAIDLLAPQAAFNYNFTTSDSAVPENFVVLVGSSAVGDVVFFKTTTDECTPKLSIVSPSTAISGTVVNNRFFLKIGAQKLSYLGYNPAIPGDSIYRWGLPPVIVVTGPVIANKAAVGVPPMPADTYAVYASTYMLATGAESNPTFLGEVTTTAANPNITIGLTSDGANGFPRHTRVYLQRLSTQAQPYLVSTVYRSDVNQVLCSDGNIPTADVSYSIALGSSAEELADAVTPLPGLFENSEPPNEMQYLVTYGNRLIGASQRKLFWSKLNLPDAFPPENFEFIDTTAGDVIVGLAAISEERLLVFTNSSVWVVNGNDPQSWTIDLLDSTVGCAHSGKSIIQFEDAIAWWSPQYGPVIMRNGKIEKIGLELLGRQEQYLSLNNDKIVGGWDPYYQHIVWAVVNAAEAGRNRLLPYNYRLNAWAAEYWDPLYQISTMFTARTNLGEERLYIADAYNTLYTLDHRAKFDGMVSPTTGLPITPYTGTFTSSVPQTTISGLTSAMKGLVVTIIDTLTGEVWDRVGVLSTGGLAREASVEDGQEYTWYVGCPYFRVELPTMDGGKPFVRKRHDRLFVDIKTSSISVPVIVKAFINRNPLTVRRTIDVYTTTQIEASTNVPWDVDVRLTLPFVKKRLNLFLNGQTCAIVFEQPAPETCVLSHLELTGRAMNDRYFG